MKRQSTPGDAPMASLRLRFCAIDTWFFRELRPQGGPGGMPLDSVFPPPPRTVDGALRMLLHEATGIALNPPGQRSNNGLNSLRTRGPWPTRLAADGSGERLLPWPQHILRNDDGQCMALAPTADIVTSDLGPTRLVQALGKGWRAPQDSWLPESAFYALLAGDMAAAKQALTGEGGLYERETRLGIARNPASHATQEGMLYQLKHIRPAQDLAFEVELIAPPSRHGGPPHPGALDALARLADFLAEGSIVRLGAEGRAAHVSVLAPAAGSAHACAPAPTLPAPGAQQNLLIVFTSHADFGGNWHPKTFTPCEARGYRTWRGFVDAASGVEIDIISAVHGKPLREGGWDSAKGRPRDAISLLPAGSVWFCKLLRGDLSRLISERNLPQIGSGRELGRGEIVFGHWNDKENPL